MSRKNLKIKDQKLKISLLVGLLSLFGLISLLALINFFTNSKSSTTPTLSVKSVNAQSNPDKFLLKKSDIANIYPQLESQFKSGDYLPYIYSTDKDQPFILTKSEDSIQKHIFSNTSLEVRLEEYNPKSRVFESKGISKPIYQYQKDNKWNNFSLSGSVNYTTKQVNDTIIITQTQSQTSVVWEIGIKNDTPLLKNTFNLTSPNTTNRLVWQISFPDQYANELKNLSVKPEAKKFKLSDIEVGWGDFMESSTANLNLGANALEITFLPEGKSGNLDIDPTFSTSVGATYIEVDDGTRYWCFGPGPDSTTNQRFFQPALFYHSSTGDPTACNSGGDNLLIGSRTGDQSGLDGFFDGETALSDGSTNVVRLIESTPSRAVIQVYRNTTIDSKATYTIYPNGYGYTSYQIGTATQFATPGLFIHYDESNTAPQTDSLDTTNNTWVVSDTSNSNYAGLAYLPYALDSALTPNTLDSSTTNDYYGYYATGAGYNDYIDDLTDYVFLSDWSTYRATTYTRDRKREDYRSPANLQSNIIGGRIWDQNGETSRAGFFGFEGADTDLCGGGDGWTTGSCNADDTAIGNFTTDPFTGNYSARFTGGATTTDVAYSQFSVSGLNEQSLSVRLAFKVLSETLGNNQSITIVELFENSSTTTDQNLEIRQNGSGQLILCILDNADARTCGATPLSTNIWYESEIRIGNNQNPRIEIFLNGKSETFINGASSVSNANPDRVRVGLVDSSTAQNSLAVDNVAINYVNTGPSFFNPREGAYTLRHNWQGDIAVKLDRSGLIASDSAMLISNWRNLNDPGSVLLNGLALSDATDYNADVLPISESWVNDSDGACGTSGWQRLSEGGDTADTEEYLADPNDNFSFENGGGSSNCTWGNSSSDALYFGRQDRFTGLNTQLSTNGAGTPTVTWEYCSANTDVATACDTWSSLSVNESVTGASTFTDSGTIFWTWPSQPLRSTENSGREALYYVRARVTAGSYSTYPVESIIKSDILLFQHLGTLTGVSNFTFKQQQVASWRINEASGNTLNDSLGTNHLTTSGANWNLDGSPSSNRYTSLRFDGSNDYASRANDTDFNFGNGSFSVAGWFKHPSAVTGTDVLFARASAVNGIGYKVYMNSSGNLCFGIDDDTSSFPEDSACSTTTYIDSNWHHFSAVKTRTNRIDLYIDGKLQASDTSISATGTLDSSATLYLGIDADGSSNPWDGFIDEVNVYSIPMTTTQVLADYQDPSTALFGSNPTDPLTNGLVGYWKMDESAANTCSGGVNDNCDSTGNNNNGAWNGNTTTSIGRFGNGTTYDGTGDYVNISDSSSLRPNNDSWSVFVWANPANSNQLGALLSKRQNAGDFEQYELGIAADLDGNNPGQNLVAYFRESEDIERRCISTEDIADGNWHLYGFVANKNSNTLTMYRDGVPLTNSSCQTDGVWPTINNTDPLQIGNNNGTNYYTGNIDEARIYSRALSPREVEQLYNYAPPPTFYLNADTNTGTTTYNTGTVGDNSGFDSADMGWTNGKFGPGIETYLNSSSTGSGIGYDNGSSHVSSTARSFTLMGYFNIKNATGLSYWFEQPLFVRMASTNSGGCTTQSGLMAEARSATSVYIHASLAYQNVGSSCNQTTDVGYGSNQVTIGQWNHIALTYNGSNNQIQLYLNGILVESATWGGSGDWTFIDTNIYVGNYGLSANAMNIAIDEIKAYNYVRTPKQIMEDVNGGHPSVGSPVGSYTSYWNFDETYGTTANDKSINANNLTLSGVNWNRSGKFNTAWDGADNRRVTGTDNTDLEPATSEDFAISAWVKSDAAANPGASQYIVSKSVSGSAGYDLIFNTSGQLSCRIDDDTASYPESTVTTTVDYYDATWHHVVCVRDIATSRLLLYVDGRLDTTTSSITATGSLAGTAVFYIGDNNGTDGTDEFLGDVDEVKFYRLGLTLSDVQVEYNSASSSVLGSYGTAPTPSPGLERSANRQYCIPGDTATCTPPVGEWNLNENSDSNAQDTSGNGYTAAITNALWSQGKVGSALRFDGSGDYATVTSPTNLSITNWTLNAWVYPTASGDYKTVYWKGGSGADEPTYDLQVHNSNLLCEFFDNTSQWRTCTSSGSEITTNSWHFISCTYDSQNIRIYRNGIQLNSCSFTQTPVTDASRNLGIGRDLQNPTTNDWPGLLDQLQIFNYARTPAQIAYDYNRGAPLLWYKFDECSGDTVYDSSGRGITGTITAGATGNTSAGTCNSGNSTEMRNDGTTGKFNNALGFDATSDYVQSANSPGLPTGDFTYSAWVYPNVNSPDRLFMASDGSGNNEISISIGGCSTAKICVDLNGGAPTASTQSVTPLTWSHIVVTRSGSTISMYLNGNLDPTTMTDSTTLNFSTCPLMIGTDVDSSCAGSLGNWFDGLIDEVQVYNYSLTTAQIKNLYNQNSAVRFGPQTGSP